MYRLKVLILLLFDYSMADIHLNKRLYFSESNNQLQILIELLVEEVAESSQCIVSMMDTYYRRNVDVNQLKSYSYLPMYRISIRENEEFFPPRRRLLRTLKESKYSGCDVYIILLANGLQVANLLQYAEEHYVEFKRRPNRELKKHEWYDLNTVSFPARAEKFVITKYIDTWYQNRFRYGIDHFATKTNNLRKQKLRVAIFEHIPAVTEDAKIYYKNQKSISSSSKPLGIEFEMLLIIAKALNFKPVFYQPDNIQTERWGNTKNETFTGMFGEAKEGNAVFYLGDFYYTMRHLQLLELSWPYNTECLTFLTLESLTENSWKLLILPFRLYTWIAVIFTLLLAGTTFFVFALCYKRLIKTNIKLTNESGTITKASADKKKYIYEKQLTTIEEWKGLYLFTDPQNSVLYTYSMLLQVSLPYLPTAWSLRVFIGWWWIFSILITVTYRASMTAMLTNSIERVTIDTLSQLVKSSASIGSWSDETKDFFANSSDVYLQKLSDRYIPIIDEQDAIAAVVNGTICYYENIHVLRHERVKRQILEAKLQNNGSQDSKHKFMEHNLHIMEECVVNIPVSLGMDKHSPLKIHVDKLIKYIIEAGFVEKWLSDVTLQSKILELRQEGSAQKAIINLDKLQGAIVALGIGFFFSIIALAAELWYWKNVILRNPNFNKYRMDLFYKKCSVT